MPTHLTADDISAAILGYRSQQSHIEAKIADLKAKLSGHKADPAPIAQAPSRKRWISKAGREAIAAAQKKRWHEARRKAADEEKQREEAKQKRIAGLAKARKALAAARRAQAKKSVAKKAVSSTTML